MRKVKIFSLFFVIILLFSTFGLSITGSAVFSPSFDLNSEGVYMVNLDTGIVVASKNPDKRLYPASTTKIMTLLVALEALENKKNFNAKVECAYECFNEFAWSGEYYNPNYAGASNAAIEPRQDNITYNDCLYALILRSGCEAANIIAYNLAGSLDKFVEMMNQTADKIGCKNTHFANAHGLFNENNYTSAYDMYLITRYMIDKYPGCMKYIDETEYSMPANDSNPNGYAIYSTNRMMDVDSIYFDSGVRGVKTGSIDEYYLKKNGEWDTENPIAGFCSLVTMCERDGYKYLLVTLQSPWEDRNGETGVTHFQDHQKLYDWAYSEFERKEIVKKNQQVMKVDVEMGKDTDKVGIITKKAFYTLIPKSIDGSAIQQIMPTVEPFTAPVEKGVSVGNLELKLNGETLAVIPLETEERIQLDNVAKLKHKVKTVMTSTGVVASIIIMVVMIIAFTISKCITNRILARNAEMARRRKIQMAPQGKNVRRK